MASSHDDHPELDVPAVDLRAAYASLKAPIDAAVARVLASGTYVGGPEVERFEAEFAAFCGTAHAVGVSSGTDALRFALIAAGVGPGDEVVTSPFTFVATGEAISQAGARPVFADIVPSTFTLDPRAVEAALSPRTRAIVPVHLYGHPADMDPLLDLARKRGLAVIEDACQAHGAQYRGRAAGALADAGCFSFYPTKNLAGCGEGGMVTTGRRDLAERIRRLRDHGQSAKYVHAEEGYNGRLDALQAAVLRVRLERLPALNDRRRDLAGLYRDGLDGASLTLPSEMPWARHVYHLFAVRAAGRDRVRETLAKRGVSAGVHYPVPLHRQPCYARLGRGAGSFPHSEKAAAEILTLPLYPEMSDAQVAQVCGVLRGALESPGASLSDR